MGFEIVSEVTTKSTEPTGERHSEWSKPAIGGNPSVAVKKCHHLKMNIKRHGEFLTKYS